MPIIWTCCHCGTSTRMPDVMDGLQGRCRECYRHSVVQGVYVDEDEDSEAANLRVMVPDVQFDADEVARQEAQFPLRDFEARGE